MTSHTKRFPRVNVIAGLLLVAVGLLANPWTLGPLLRSPDVTIWLDAKIVVWGLELVCVVVGLLVVFRGKTAERRKRLLFGFMAFVLMLVVVEIGLHVGNAVLGLFRGNKDVADARCLLSPYRDQPWAGPLFKELHQLSEEYEPYLGWDRQPYRGKYTNIDAEGVRRTWNPPDGGDKPGTIYMFGGSTLWGSGARDEHTIPSHLSKLLHKSGQAFVVCNYGETAYTFTQEVVHLALLLRDGHRPDYVIFYDGANDVYAAYQSGMAGAPQNLYTFKAKLKKWSNTELMWLGAVRTIKDHCMIYRAIRKVAVVLSPRQAFRERGARYDAGELRTLCEGIVEEYVKSMGLLGRLAQAYGFQYLCLWQPLAFTDEKLTAEEAAADPRLRDEALAQLYRDAPRLLSQRRLARFVVLADALRGRQHTCYIDYCHLSEEGNAMVASKILDVFKQEFLTK